MPGKKKNRGVRRSNSGRREASGNTSRRKARVNRVVVMLDEDDYRVLERRARKRRLPLGTAAYHLMHEALKQGN